MGMNTREHATMKMRGSSEKVPEKYFSGTEAGRCLSKRRSKARALGAARDTDPVQVSLPACFQTMYIEAH